MNDLENDAPDGRPFFLRRRKFLLSVSVISVIVLLGAIFLFPSGALGNIRAKLGAVISLAWQNANPAAAQPVLVLDLDRKREGESEERKRIETPDLADENRRENNFKIAATFPAAAPVNYSAGSPSSSSAQSADSSAVVSPAKTAIPSTAPKPAPPHPVADCAFAAAAEPHHQVLINEIAWMGGASASDEWLELRNNSGAKMNLAGWQILSADGDIQIIFEPGESIPDSGFYLLERTDDESVTGVAADKIYRGSLPNGGTHLRLFDSNCRLADEMDASAGWPAGDRAARKTLERNVVNFAWHTSNEIYGTPRARNFQFTPIVASGPTPTPPAGGSESEPNGNSAPAPVGQVNINTAGAAELQGVTGIGAVLAERIISYRTQSGNFQKIEDIQNVSGIGPATFEKMRSEITVGEAKSESASGGAIEQTIDVKININSAGPAELQNITGVGPTIAQRIIEYREQNGPFEKIEEIKNVNGIGDATFEKMKNEIAV